MAIPRPLTVSNPFDRSQLVTAEVAPAASLSLLRTVDASPLDLAAHPYMGCARIATIPTGGRYWRQVSPPNGLHAIAAVGGNAALAVAGRPPMPVRIASETGGLTGANIIQAVTSPWILDTDPLDTTSGVPQIAITSQTIDDSPAATKPRAIELGTEENRSGSEIMWVDGATCWSVAAFHQLDAWVV